MSTVTQPTSGSPATSGEVVLEAQDIVMRFGGLTAVNNVSFQVHEGEILGLIGPN